MRIAYMLTSLGIGGAEKQVIAIGERMAARGHNVALIVLRPAEKREWPTTLNVYRIGMTKSVPGILGGLIRARRVLGSFKPDLLHSHTLPANMAARILRGIGGAPLVVSTIHNVYEGGRHRMLGYRITDHLCAHTTAVSCAAADRYVQIGAVPQNKCSVITNGIDTDAFSPSIAIGRTEYTAHVRRPFIWLAAGRDVPAKDFDTLLAAFRKVRAVFPDTQLQIAGEPASHRANLIDDGVRWLGVVEDMPKAFAGSDAFVLSSAWEGLPLVVAEAMAMEKPIVATDVGGVSELTGYTPEVVPAKDLESLSDAMLRTMRMPLCERSEIGKAGRRRITERFNINDKIDEWEGLYSRVLQQRKSSRKRSISAK
ncbi:MAG: glycosyltransferase [Acidobacteria bacterium]|nr:glycosyltransferase [Acidobacteriota bacterium]